MKNEFTPSPIVELRQYTLHPGKRDDLIELFDREFVESQEAAGIRVIGQFRDLDHPDRFVWLRGFPTMPDRAQALNTFYGGPVWKMWREAANATMIDSDNVLLLRPARPASGFSLDNSNRLPPGSHAVQDGFVSATISYLDAPADSDFIDYFENVLKPVLLQSGGSLLAYFVSEDSPNTFPALPVREGEPVFMWFMGFQDQAAYEQHRMALTKFHLWDEKISGALLPSQKRKPDLLRLSPTTRSRLTGKP